MADEPIISIAENEPEKYLGIYCLSYCCGGATVKIAISDGESEYIWDERIQSFKEQPK